MFLAQVTFGPPPLDIDAFEVEEAVDGYIGALQRNGQLCGDIVQSVCGGIYAAYAYMAQPDSISRDEFHSMTALAARDRVAVVFDRHPAWKVLDDKQASVTDFSRSSSLYVFATSLYGMSPICCGDSGERMPMYLLSVTEAERQELSAWSGDYDRFDGIWISSGALEIPAYEQLASPHSDLAIKGRRLASVSRMRLEFQRTTTLCDTTGEQIKTTTVDAQLWR